MITVTKADSVQLPITPRPATFIVWKGSVPVISLVAEGEPVTVHIAEAGITVTDVRFGTVRFVANADFDLVQMTP